MFERLSALALKGEESVASTLRQSTVVLRRDKVNHEEFDWLLENLVDTMLPREAVGKRMSNAGARCMKANCGLSLDFTEAVVKYTDDDDTRARASLGAFLANRATYKEWRSRLPHGKSDLMPSETRPVPCIGMLDIPCHAPFSDT